MFINVGHQSTVLTTPAIPLLGDVVFVYRPARAASVSSSMIHPKVLSGIAASVVAGSEIYPTVKSEAAAPVVIGDSVTPTVQTGVEI